MAAAGLAYSQRHSAGHTLFLLLGAEVGVLVWYHPTSASVLRPSQQKTSHTVCVVLSVKSLVSVVTNSSTYYLNRPTVVNSQKFSIFKLVFQ